MIPDASALGVWLVSYLIGSVPVGYLTGRLCGVNLFQAGSGNVGATNAARVLGKKIGTAVFMLDFLKGAVPVALVPWLTASAGGSAVPANWLGVGAAAAAFLGHLFPVTLGFRGGKGVATGAGVVAVLVPVPFAAALFSWILLALTTRFVSVASIGAALALLGVQVARSPSLTDPVTLLCSVGGAFVIFKHWTNVKRLRAGTETRIGEFAMRSTLVRGLHVVAAGLWFGGAAFFSFAAAPAIFASFRDVVENAPSDRTVGVAILPPESSPEARAALASALAGAAVGPVFPRFFAMQLACGLVCVVTAWSWRETPGGRRRIGVFAVALALVALGWPLSDFVSELRLDRFNPDPAVRAAARAAFGPWHLLSLALSAVTTLLAGAGLALAGQLPDSRLADRPLPVSKLPV